MAAGFHTRVSDVSDMSKAALFRALLKKPGIIAMPGCYAPFVAMIAQKVGFKAAYISGGAITTCQGMPDIELLSGTEMVRLAGDIAASVTIPCICDADTGYGGPLSIRKTVQEFERAGIAGIHLEDQQSPKRCGHLQGKTLVSTKEMVQRILAAVDGRKDRDFLIIARTDAAASEGMEGAVRRAEAYVEAGADAIFPEALGTKEDFARFARSVDVPLLANMTEFGKTPYLTAAEFGELGYKMVIFPLTAMSATLKAVEDTLIELRDKGTQKHILDRFTTRDERYELIRYAEYQRLDTALAERTESIGKKDGGKNHG